MTAHQWPTDAEMDRLTEQAAATRSQALRFDPESLGGFRALTPEEDRELINALAGSDQRYAEDREHLIRECDDAIERGDLDAAEAADAHLGVLDAERRLADRHTPAPEPDWWDRARFDDSLELARTQLTFPAFEREADDAEREA